MVKACRFNWLLVVALIVATLAIFRSGRTEAFTPDPKLPDLLTVSRQMASNPAMPVPKMNVDLDKLIPHRAQAQAYQYQGSPSQFCNEVCGGVCVYETGQLSPNSYIIQLSTSAKRWHELAHWDMSGLVPMSGKDRYRICVALLTRAVQEKRKGGLGSIAFTEYATKLMAVLTWLAQIGTCLTKDIIATCRLDEVRYRLRILSSNRYNGAPQQP